jgi:peptide/nickel transport system substrate-binding protein
MHPRLDDGAEVDHTRVRSALPVDAKTLRVVLRAPYADWRYLFDSVLPRHVLVGKDLESVWRGGIDDPKTRRAIGSGPFVFERWQHGKQLTFVRNPRYWGPHPAYLDRIVFRFLPVEHVEPALRRGEIDMIDPAPAILGASADEFHRRPAAGVRALLSLCGCYEHVTIRLGEGGHLALRTSRLVRQALAYGIDRVAIARETGRLSGAGLAALQPVDSVVHLPSSRYYRPNWQRYRHQPGRARRLLEQAGCSLGADDIYACAGQRLSLRFVAPAGVERRELTVRLAQAQLRQVGVEVRPVFASPQTVFGQILPSGDFDLILFGWGSGASTSSDDVFGCQRSSNYMDYCDRLVTRDLIQATRIVVASRRAELLNGIDERLAKAVPIIPLYQPSGFWAFKATLRGIVPNAPGGFAWNSEDWWLDR